MNQIRVYIQPHSPGADSLCSLLAVFPTCEKLCGTVSADNKEEYQISRCSITMLDIQHMSAPNHTK